MKIVHTEASWGWGGQEIRVLRECALLIAAGHEVQLLADPQSLIAQRAGQYGVPVVQTRLAKKRIADLLAMASVLKRIDPDVVACHSSTDHWLAAVARLLFKRRYRIVRFRHISTPVAISMANRWLYCKGCEAIITTGKYIRDLLRNFGLVPAERVWSIPTGIDPQRFAAADMALAKQKLGIDSAQFVVGIVATLRSWKGHDYLVQAVNQLDDPGLTLLIVGDGPRHQHLQTLARNTASRSHILFAGHQQDVVPYLQALDLFALPSYANEGVPQAMLQAMAMGLPMVCCPTGGIPEAIEHYPHAMVVDSKNAAALAGAIHLAAQERLRAHHQTAPHVPFSEDWMLKHCLEIYQGLV